MIACVMTQKYATLLYTCILYIVVSRAFGIQHVTAALERRFPRAVQLEPGNPSSLLLV